MSYWDFFFILTINFFFLTSEQSSVDPLKSLTPLRGAWTPGWEPMTEALKVMLSLLQCTQHQINSEVLVWQ